MITELLFAGTFFAALLAILVAAGVDKILALLIAFLMAMSVLVAGLDGYPHLQGLLR